MDNFQGDIHGVSWKVYNADCKFVLNNIIGNNTIDCIVTSPPYYNQRSYGDKVTVDGNQGQWKYSRRKVSAEYEIGIACEYQKYLYDLTEVISACYNVLKANKLMFINIGNKRQDKEYIDCSHDIIKIAKNVGFTHCDTIIWIKRNSQPPGKHKELHLGNGWEYILMFSKGKDYRINSNAYLSTSSHYQCSNCGKDNYVNLKSNPNYFYSNIGCFGNTKKAHSHPAPFPETIPKFCLSLAAHEHDLILDPFAGSGTTLKVALGLNINCVGCELIPKIYLDLIDNLQNIK